jgi:phage gp36-like protein
MSSYATVDDVKELGLPAAALEELTDAQIQGQLDTTAGVIDLYLGQAVDLPISAPYPEWLRRCNIDLAVCEIFLFRGYNPEEFDSSYKERCRKWMDILEDIAGGGLKPPGIDDGEPTGGALVYTNPVRGW